MQRIGLIAGNGKFSFLVLDAARAAGYEVVVIAIKDETSPEIEGRGAASTPWLSLGELSKLIESVQQEGVRRAIIAGLFFFSSRRRHTRCLSDWSSDVCSSDLKSRGQRSRTGPAARRGELLH